MENLSDYFDNTFSLLLYLVLQSRSPPSPMYMPEAGSEGMFIPSQH